MFNAFNPQELELFAKILEEASLKLGCDQVQKEAVAARILSHASCGPRDYESLLAVAMSGRNVV